MQNTYIYDIYIYIYIYLYIYIIYIENVIRVLYLRREWISSYPHVFCKKGVLRNFAKCTGGFLWILGNFQEHLFTKNTSSGCVCTTLFLANKLVSPAWRKPNWFRKKTIFRKVLQFNISGETLTEYAFLKMPFIKACG